MEDKEIDGSWVEKDSGKVEAGKIKSTSNVFNHGEETLPEAEEKVVRMTHVNSSFLKSLGQKVKSSKKRIRKDLEKQITLCVV